MNNTTPVAIGADALRADLINDLREVFDSTSAETPQDVRDVIEYADSWLSVYVQKRFDQASAAQQPAPREPLTREQMEKGREAIFSTDNPYCPCDSKTFRKVAEWVERHHGITARKEQS